MSEKTSSSRIIAFDLLRGYFLVAIILNHLFLYPNLLTPLTARGELFVSAAEGFFLLSGIVLGIVRGRKLIGKPFKAAAQLLLKRAWVLYAAYVVLTLGFTAVGWWFFIDNPGLKSGIAASDTSWWMVIWKTLTFQYLYGWADYLRLYIIFLIASPLVVWLLRRGKWWVALAGSIAIWLVTPVTAWPESVYLQPYKWQLIFFSGMIIGYHWPDIVTKWKAIPKQWQQLTIALLVTSSLLLLGANLFLAFGGKISHEIYDIVSPIRSSLHDHHFDKENMPLARLALFFLWFWASFWLLRRFEPFFSKWFGWLLVPLGTNSLYVYIVHGIMIFSVHLFITPAGHGLDIISNTLITLAIIMAIWIMVHYKILFKIIPR